MLISTLRWRKSFDVEAAMKEQFPEDVFGQLGKIYGKDKEGRPVAYVHYPLTMTHADTSCEGITCTAQIRIWTRSSAIYSAS